MNGEQTNLIFTRLKEALTLVADKNDLFDEKLSINCKFLTAEEAIGRPKDQDYPIIRGKEKMIEASFRGSIGQAFTDDFRNSSYTVRQLMELELDSNRVRADFIAGLNAVYRYLDLTGKTIHCRDEEPIECAGELLKLYRNPARKITMIGLQPRFLEYLIKEHTVRVIDLDDDNIGAVKFGVTIEDPSMTSSAIEWCDELLVTGSTIVNGTFAEFYHQKKPVTFFGVTIAATAQILGFNAFCAMGK